MDLSKVRPRRPSSVERRDPYASPEVYYAKEHWVSSPVPDRLGVDDGFGRHELIGKRRASHDEASQQPQKFVVNVEATLRDLLAREDTDQNQQITIDDNGPKVISLGTLASAGYRSKDVRGNYLMSNLLQELTLANDLGRKNVVIDLARLNENPVDRLSRFIKDTFWHNLARVIDGSVIERVGKDPKDRSSNPRPRIYIPCGAPEQFEYYSKVAEERPEIDLDVQWLPEGPITPEYVRGINDKPGLLALETEAYLDPTTGEEILRGLPFIVPGGRFNELYGWDSYMSSLGLLVHGRVDICKSMVRNFCFCIKHYGKILNANRSYYLCRSQPPFLTDMAIRVYDRTKHLPEAEAFLKTAILAAIKEYYSVWMAEPRYDPVTGLSRYRPEGLGVPPETEASHFLHVLSPYAEKHDMAFDEFVHAYNSEQIYEPDLDEYFLHDRAVRESGHDTSYRLEHVAANLATVDLNSLLYKYETDIARTIHEHFRDRLDIPDEFQTPENRIDKIERSSSWDRRAKRRKLLMDKYLWNEEKGMYFDYDTVRKVRTNYESVTTFWAMWAGVASPRQAAMLVLNALPKFECAGGLVSGTEKSRGRIDVNRPNRQWDYPYGWAPQQMLAWAGLQRYNYQEEARMLAYKWLYMLIKTFNDFNGVVVEKYNVTVELDPHKVDAEYGNQGSDIRGVPREGFGWANASFVVGLQIVNSHMKRALGTMTPWDTFHRATMMQLEDEIISEEAEFEPASMTPV